MNVSSPSARAASCREQAANGCLEWTLGPYTTALCVNDVLESTSAEARKEKRMSLFTFKDVLAVGLVGALLVAGPARAASAGQQAATPAVQKVEDSTLESRIEASLEKDAALAARDLDVDVSAGIATLKGTVRTAGEKARAARLATIKGVVEVRNELVVDATAAKSGADKAIDATKRAGEKTAEVTKDAAVATGEKTKEVAVATAKKTKEVASATGEAITDGWITTKLKAKFVDESLLKDSDINVDTNDHVVTLKGTVASSAAKARAAVIAGETEGVKRVVNQLVVKGM
jgi:hyperosmotically inducible protein